MAIARWPKVYIIAPNRFGVAKRCAGPRFRIEMTIEDESACSIVRLLMTRFAPQNRVHSGVKILEFFSRQRPGNPIERLKTGLEADNWLGLPVQNIFKKLKKNLVSLTILQ